MLIVADKHVLKHLLDTGRSSLVEVPVRLFDSAPDATEGASSGGGSGNGSGEAKSGPDRHDEDDQEPRIILP
jgi:hypothetical protein